MHNDLNVSTYCQHIAVNQRSAIRLQFAIPITIGHTLSHNMVATDRDECSEITAAMQHDRL